MAVPAALLILSLLGVDEAGPTRLLFAEYRVLARGALGRGCVFSPSCSRYAAEAFDALGPLAGTAVSLERWTRCHALARADSDYLRAGGLIYDPLTGGRGALCSWGRLLLPF
jgi:putative component of membrane protein insertase Oxa1/YidC/SpoIIIJ protein YidD